MRMNRRMRLGLIDRQDRCGGHQVLNATIMDQIGALPVWSLFFYRDVDDFIPDKSRSAICIA